MKVAVTQPNYLPWLGWFDLLDEVDLWISLDNVDLTKRSFIVRNRVKVRNGDATWLSLRVSSFSRGTSIREARLADREFADQHLRVIRENYQDAPFFDEHWEWLEETLAPQKLSVAVHNEGVVAALAERLGVSYAFRRASELAPDLRGSAQEKILRVLKRVEEETGDRVEAYYNFATGVEEGLYRHEAFRERGTRLVKQEYDHPRYPQIGEAFLPYLSVVDLLLNVGPGSLNVIRQGRRWKEAEGG